MADVLHKTADPVDYRRSVNTPDFDAGTWFINPDVSAVVGVASKYWARPLTDPVTEMTQPEKDAVDAAEAAALIAAAKTAAKDLYDSVEEQGRILRAIVVLTVDEINIVRTWLRDFQAATAVANNLSTFKDGVAALATLSDRTNAQAKTAVDNAVDAE